MAGADPFTLGDLLRHEELALELRSGGDDARGRRVAGAHSIEIEKPSSWLAPDWVMLTAGVRLRGSADAQRELVRELDEAGVGALGFGLELVFKRVPAALLEEAEARAFPVFSVPLRTPFREITSAINRALLSSDLRTYQRLSSMQLYLVDALREPDPRGAVVSRLAELLDASVLVLSPAGAVELAAGDAPAEVLWPAIDERPTALHELDVDGWHAVATPVLAAASEDDPVEWLVVASRRSTFAHGLTKPVAQAAAPLLAATARLTATERTQARAIQAAVLDDLLEGTGDAHLLAARAASFGLDLAESARVLLVRGAPADAVERALDHARAAHLVSAHGDGPVVALAQGAAAEVRSELERLLEAEPEAVAGVGRPVTETTAVPHSLRDAQLALQRIGFGGERLLAFEDFELGLLLISEAPPERIQPKVEAWTALLRARPMLWEAVLAYFDHDLDVVRTAHALHLHPNSLRYRLTRVEKLLGRSLKQPSTIAGLYIAILASPDV